jgi:predicted Zn-dependent protease
MRIFILLFAFSLVLSSCGSKSKNPDTKLNLDQLLQKYPDSVSLLVDKGNQLIDSLEFQRALELGAKAFRLDSSNVSARVLYAECLINKPNRSADDIMRAFTMYRILVKKTTQKCTSISGFGQHARTFK